MNTDRYAAWRAPAPTAPPISPSQHDAIMGEIVRLGWAAEQKHAYLSAHYGCTHAVQLDTIQARAFLEHLRGLTP